MNVQIVNPANVTNLNGKVALGEVPAFDTKLDPVVPAAPQMCAGSHQL